MKLRSKRVLVTGASSGIGQAIAITLAKQGAYIVVNYRQSEAGATETLKQVKQHSDGEVVQADLTDRAQVVKLFESIGNIDVLVNNAGDARGGDVFDDEAWQYQHDSILMSAVYCTQQFLKQTTGHKKIVNISSLYGGLNTGNPDLMAYSVYKAAMNSLTVNLAKQANENLQVNAVEPGYTWTRPWEGISDSDKRKHEQRANINRFVTAEEIAHTVQAILENDAINGQIITVDGGLGLIKNI